MTKLLLAAAVLPFLAACGATAAEMAPPQKAALEATCSRVMGLRPGEAEFAGCVDTLSDSLARETSYDRAAAAYRACAQQGVAHGTPDFGRCVLDSEGTATPQDAAQTLNAAEVTAPANFTGGYFSASFPMRYRRAEYACATIGLQPSSGPFESCASDLDSNMWLIEHPPG
jgi:hypothetical protein